MSNLNRLTSLSLPFSRYMYRNCIFEAMNPGIFLTRAYVTRTSLAY